MVDTILQTSDLKKSFGGQVAVDGLTLDVAEQSITGMIGPNGAGKTTAFGLITGMVTPDSGEVRFRGDDITGKPPYEISRKGIGRTFQHARVFDEMSVMENLLVVPSPVDDIEAEADRLVKLVELEEERNSMGEELSGGQKMLLGIARSIMLQPDLLMLDEPFAGVNPGLVDDIVEILLQLRDEEDLTIFVISHEIETISTVAEEIIVMHNGQKLVKDEPMAVRQDERVVESYLGGAV